MLINRVLLICYHLILLFLTKAAYARRFNVQLHAAAGDVEAVRAEQDAFLDQLQQSNLNFSVRFRYTRAINAISIDIPDSNNVSLSSSPLQDIFQQQNFLTKQPLVRQYWPGKRYPRPLSPLGNNNQSSDDVKQGTPNLVEAHQMTGVHNVTWTGKGIKLAILDTGVDYTHPDLGGCIGEGCRIAHGYDLVGDHYGETDDDSPIPDSDPIDRAIEAGSNIINLSLGGDQSAWQEDALAVALSNVGDLGIMVVVAQGNEGNDGIARTPSPSIGHHVMAVGSVDNKNKLAQGFKVTNIDGEEPFFGIFSFCSNIKYVRTDINKKNFLTIKVKFISSLQHIEYRLSGDSLSNPFPDKIRLMIPISPITNYTGSLREKEKERHGCQPYQIPFEREKSDNDTYPIVALVKRGKCSFVEKALNLQNVGITGMLVYEDPIESDEPLLSVGFKAKQIQIPVGSIQNDILTLLKNNSFLDVERVNQVIELPTAGLLSK
ncbi:hypothetical protein INT45_010363 [Circinella minor]|uniref:Peptidase S8/S53 domain-containing protein n=1 Tax=Circinella minor TaxID=1195481 RepID=A0A8H7SAA9_9FUNG|nr:hypothetical protein INT45_010363 [Circinella minor]